MQLDPKHNSAWAYQAQQASVSLSNLAVPTVGEGEILVENRAIGINPVDWKFIHANPLNWRDGHIPGVDGAGVVVAIGAGVDASWLGQRVAYHAALKHDGSFAKLSVLKADRVMKVPQSLGFALAAALPCPMLTAWQAVEKVPARSGRAALIVGLGAVNKLVVQLLKLRGFTVDVISRSVSDEQAAKYGIRHVYRNQAQIAERYFAVFDAVSGDSAASLVPLLKANGHIVAIQGRVAAPIDPAFTRSISYHEIALGALHDFGDLADWQALMQDGEALLTQISQQAISVEAPVEFAFSEMPDALEHSKQKTVVLV